MRHLKLPIKSNNLQLNSVKLMLKRKPTVKISLKWIIPISSPNIKLSKDNQSSWVNHKINLGFQVEHKVTIKVQAIDHISDLADRILK